MDITLNAVDTRVLACLMEKEITTPDYYPLTLHSLVTACNQKSNRAPKMSLTNADVSESLASLYRQHLVMEKDSSRVEKYAHKTAKVLQLDIQEQALLAELMLRGPQTAGELRGRCERMVSIELVEEVDFLLECLSERDIPLVKRLPRQSGKREQRWAHLLAGEPEIFEELAPSLLVTENGDLRERVDQLEQRLKLLEALLLINGRVSVDQLESLEITEGDKVPSTYANIPVI